MKDVATFQFLEIMATFAQLTLYKMKDLVEISVGSRTDGSDEDLMIERSEDQ